MKFNPITGGAGRNANNPVKVGEKIIWQFVLNCWRLRYPLTDKVVEVYSTILSMDCSISYFSGEGSKHLRGIVPNVSAAELSRIRKELMKAKLLEDGNARGEAYPASWLLSLKKALEKENRIEFITVLEA